MIQPSELNVEKANGSDDQENYLDLTFIIRNSNRIYTKRYDKRDDFSFHIANSPSFQVIYHLAFSILGLQ